MGEENGLINISAIGDDANTAARLASKAAAGEIILSETALQQAGIDGSELESRTLELKGIESADGGPCYADLIFCHLEVANDPGGGCVWTSP